MKRHKFIAGGAAVSSSLLVLAGVAIARRLRSGQTEEEAIASLTEEELTGRKDEREPWTNDADADQAALEDDEPSADDAVADDAVAAGDVVEIEAEGEAAPSGNGHAPDDGVKQEVIPAKRGL
ncbi:MAG: hypothetical protein F4056_07525 [Chloroflexi bacterium]|nr:hypothetical protein [Chloroflexota bacterium]